MRQGVPEGCCSKGYASFKQVEPWSWHIEVIPGVSNSGTGRQAHFTEDFGVIKLLIDSLFWSLSALVIAGKDGLTGSHFMFISEPVAGGAAVALWSL